MEDTIANANAAQLREALAKYYQQQQPPPPAAPIVSGTENMSPEAQDEVSTLYCRAMMRKSAAEWTAEDKLFMRGAIGAALRSR